MWNELQASLDNQEIDPSIVHSENFFNELQQGISSSDQAAGIKSHHNKRGYNELKVSLILQAFFLEPILKYKINFHF